MPKTNDVKPVLRVFNTINDRYALVCPRHGIVMLGERAPTPPVECPRCRDDAAAKHA